MKDKEKAAFYCYLTASIFFFISAGLNFFSNDTKYMSGIHCCLGATFLYLASTYKKDKSEK